MLKCMRERTRPHPLGTQRMRPIRAMSQVIHARFFEFLCRLYTMPHEPTEEEVIADVNAYFAHSHGHLLGVSIDRAVKHPTVPNAYVVHVRGGVACSEFRANVMHIRDIDPYFNNIVQRAGARGRWNLIYHPILI
jgi:hypothetical protein